MKKLRVTVEGKSYEVLVEVLDGAAVPGFAPAAAAAPARIAPAAVEPLPAVRSAAPVAAAGSGDVTSPLAGKIVSIDVKEGDAVADGAQVATIEAMKMNTYIYASRAGRVAAVLGRPGDAVEEGGILLRLA